MIKDVIVGDVPDDADDPYTYYYRLALITPDMGCNPPRQPSIKEYQEIKKYYIGDDPYTLRHTPNPREDYNRVIPRLGDKMYVEKTDGDKHELTKENYVKLMYEFGERMKTEPLEAKMIRARAW